MLLAGFPQLLKFPMKHLVEVCLSLKERNVFDPLVAKEIIFGEKQHNDRLRLWEDKEKGRKILKAEFLALLGLQGTSGERCCCFGEG